MAIRVLAFVLGLARVARAGDMCATDRDGNLDMSADVHLLERYAAGTATADDVQFVAVCVGGAAYRDRVVAACDKILARDPHWDTCMIVAAKVGAAMVGKRDVFAWLARQPRGPWVTNSALPDYPLYLLRQLGDPRGAALIVAAWNEAIPKAARHEHDPVMMAEWSGWRQHAADALGALGGADEATFLEAQAKATVDSHVARACRDAAAAIAKRLAKP
ncbi:MAG TPA: hypothetical protein VLX92_03785 [Kofleriaceae bacterium]|nr:hypothetical protein [Kofleriaceae bacterium]